MRVLTQAVLSTTAIALALLTTPHSLLAQGAPLAAPAQQRPVDPAFAAAEKAFLALDPETRKTIQRDLIWEAKFTGTASGDFGALTFGALKRFEEANKLKPGEGLGEAGRRLLAASAGKARAAAGFSVFIDKVSGMQIGIPGKLLVKSQANASGGTRWQDKDEKVTLDLSILKPEDTLPVLFEKGTSAAVQGRKITYKLLRPDFFVIAGETEKGKFYRRVTAASQGGPRSLSIGYDKSMAAQVDPLVVAIAASFDPFPSAAPVVAQKAPAATPSTAVPTPTSPAASAQRRATGLVIGPDAILTAEAGLKGCAEIGIAGDRASLKPVRKLDGDLLLLAGKGGAVMSARLATASEGGATLVQRGLGGELLVASARIEGKRVEGPLQEGGAGALLFDRAGALVGIVADAPKTKFRVAGVVPSLTYAFVPAGEALKAAGIATPTASSDGAARSGAEIGEAARASAVPLVCLSDR